MDSAVALAAGDAALNVAPAIGGAVTLFTWRGKPVLRPTSPASIAASDVRTCGCYPLVPYSNRIRDAKLRFDGRTYALAHNFGDHPNSIHGVGWQRAWTVAARSGASVQLRLHHDGVADPGGWPWSFEARQTFTLSADDRACTLHVTMTITSLADAPFPFGLGWHPFFPKPPDARLQFDARGVWRNDATQLPLALEALSADTDFSVERPLEGVVLDNVFVGWNGHALIERGDMTVAIDAERACGCLVVYAPQGRDFVAVEPVSHETDAFNRAADGATDTGMRVLGPGTSFSCTMRLTAR